MKTFFRKELWFSFVAIAKYFPTAIFDRRIRGLDFFKPENLQEITRRINSVTLDSPRAWGTMNASQMLHHLNLATGGALGFFHLFDESYLLSRTLFKWILVDFFSEQPKGLRLPLNFVISTGSQYDFESEKMLLLAITKKAAETTNDNDWEKHPFFGKLTKGQWGKLLQMHIDYHLRQFNV